MFFYHFIIVLLGHGDCAHWTAQCSNSPLKFIPIFCHGTNFRIEFDTVVSNNIYGEGISFLKKEESYGNHEKGFYKGSWPGFDQP